MSVPLAVRPARSPLVLRDTFPARALALPRPTQRSEFLTDFQFDASPPPTGGEAGGDAPGSVIRRMWSRVTSDEAISLMCGSKEGGCAHTAGKDGAKSAPALIRRAIRILRTFPAEHSRVKRSRKGEETNKAPDSSFKTASTFARGHLVAAAGQGVSGAWFVLYLGQRCGAIHTSNPGEAADALMKGMEAGNADCLFTAAMLRVEQFRSVVERADGCGGADDEQALRGEGTGCTGSEKRKPSARAACDIKEAMRNFEAAARKGHRRAARILAHMLYSPQFRHVHFDEDATGPLGGDSDPGSPGAPGSGERALRAKGRKRGAAEREKGKQERLKNPEGGGQRNETRRILRALRFMKRSIAGVRQDAGAATDAGKWCLQLAARCATTEQRRSLTARAVSFFRLGAVHGVPVAGAAFALLVTSRDVPVETAVAAARQGWLLEERFKSAFDCLAGGELFFPEDANPGRRLPPRPAPIPAIRAAAEFVLVRSCVCLGEAEAKRRDAVTRLTGVMARCAKSGCGEAMTRLADLKMVEYVRNRAHGDARARAAAEKARLAAWHWLSIASGKCERGAALRMACAHWETARLCDDPRARAEHRRNASLRFRDAAALMSGSFAELRREVGWCAAVCGIWPWGSGRWRVLREAICEVEREGIGDAGARASFCEEVAQECGSDRVRGAHILAAMHPAQAATSGRSEAKRAKKVAAVELDADEEARVKAAFARVACRTAAILVRNLRPSSVEECLDLWREGEHMLRRESADFERAVRAGVRY